MTSILDNHSTYRQRSHACGGTVLSGPDHVYCDRCGAVVYYGPEMDAETWEEAVAELDAEE